MRIKVLSLLLLMGFLMPLQACLPSPTAPEAVEEDDEEEDEEEDDEEEGEAQGQ